MICTLCSTAIVITFLFLDHRANRFTCMDYDAEREGRGDGTDGEGA